MCWPRIGINTLFGDSAGDENLAIMANLSKTSDMMALEGLPEDLCKGIDINMHTHCYRVTKQGVIMMKIFAIDELRMYDLPKHSKSIASFISDLLNFVDDLIDKKKSLLDVAGQDTIRPSQT